MDLHARKRSTPSSFVQYAWKTCLLVGIYWLFSIGITFYQKHLINAHHFPLTIVLCHMVLKYIFAVGVRWVSHRHHFKYFTVNNDESSNRESNASRSKVFQVAVPAAAGALDIGLSNWSYEYVTLTVYTITKSTSIVFILIFAVILRLEKLRPTLAVTILLIPTGLGLFMYRSEAFSFIGLSLLLGASALSGVRWSMSQLLMQHRGMSSPIEMMYRMLPWMIITLVPLALAIEGRKLFDAWTVAPMTTAISTENSLWNFDTVTSMAALIIGGALLAFFMEISEYLLLLYTSGLSLSISSVFKELLVMLLSYMINSDVMSPTNFAGACLCIVGTILYVVLKSLRLAKQENSDAPGATGATDVGSGSVNAGSYAMVPTQGKVVEEDKIPLTDAARFKTDTTDDDDDDDEEEDEEDVMFHRR